MTKNRALCRAFQDKIMNDETILLRKQTCDQGTQMTSSSERNRRMLLKNNEALKEITKNITRTPKKYFVVGYLSILVISAFCSIFIILMLLTLFVPAFSKHDIFPYGSTLWVVVTSVTHFPYFMVLFYLAAGILERYGFMIYDMPCMKREKNTKLPLILPKCCIQLAMFNEDFVCERVIEASCALDWPKHLLEIQVLDDSTDKDISTKVDNCVTKMKENGYNCYILRRKDRKGYKAGALEAGRKLTDAEFLALFDADFIPTSDFLMRTIPQFYNCKEDGELESIIDLALIQTRWGHLNAWDNFVTVAQSLWIDDHHAVQMQWRSDVWDFVNFTGTAGIWRASAINTAGGWRSASLVEDCELSFRVLFAGYKTAFDNSIVQPSEVPDSLTAYKAQQKRWTQGWVQLARMHFVHLIFRHECSFFKRIALTYQMCIVWQWPAWSIWLFSNSLLRWFGLVYGNTYLWMFFYIAPMTFWLVSMTIFASIKAPTEILNCQSIIQMTFTRLMAYIFLNTGMLPHQFCSFAEGLFENLHSEFERTPKKGNQTAGNVAASIHLLSSEVENPKKNTSGSKIHWYLWVEVLYSLYTALWAALFLYNQDYLDTLFFSFLSISVVYQLTQYGDDQSTPIVNKIFNVIIKPDDHSKSEAMLNFRQLSHFETSYPSQREVDSTLSNSNFEVMSNFNQSSNSETSNPSNEDEEKNLVTKAETSAINKKWHHKLFKLPHFFTRDHHKEVLPAISSPTTYNPFSRIYKFLNKKYQSYHRHGDEPINVAIRGYRS